MQEKKIIIAMQLLNDKEKAEQLNGGTNITP